MCASINPRVKQKCMLCGAARPARKVPAHRAALAEPYEWWVAQFGERCGICGAARGTRRLHRDHEHAGAGRARGLLCFRCNAALRSYMTLEWMRAAVAYLERANTRTAAAYLDRSA